MSGEAPNEAPPPAKPASGGFKIPKLAPPPEPSEPAPTAAADPTADPTADADASARKQRKHKGTRKHKHLLVLDLNGLLVDRRMSAFVDADGTRRAPDAKFGKFFIYNRPHMAAFVEWAFEHFTVGVWSSAQAHNAKSLVNHVWGKHRDKLAFVWGQDRCTHVGAMDRAKPNSKPILLKDLNKLWAIPSYARFGPRNTLLLDDSPYKAAMNPPNCAIHPAEYKLARPDPAADPARSDEDNVLGVGGELREYLAKLADADHVDAFVEASPWAEHGPAAPPSSDEVMRKAREGGAAVAAAVAAAAMTGRDANEIELPDDDEDELDEDDATKGIEQGQGHERVIDADGWGGSDDEAEDDDVDEAAKMEANAEALDASRRDANRKREAEGEVEGASNAPPETEPGTEPGTEPNPNPNPNSRKKPKRVFTGSGASLFIRRWAWKREAKSDEERFSQPYAHEMQVRTGSAVPMGFDADDGDSSTRTVSMRFAQRGFGDGGADGGFASTVWDSAIVLAKYVERHQEKFRGVRACELGAGCGVVSAALVAAGASRVVATDLPENLSLLRQNLLANCGGEETEGNAWDVRPLAWGPNASAALGGETFDLVVATDCMYIDEAAGALVDTLASLVGDVGVVGGRAARYTPGAALFAYGRNRQAEASFERECGAGAASGRDVTLRATDVREEDLDELYQCSDVRVVHYAMERTA